MDLRPYRLSASQLEEAVRFIRDGSLRYQPFIFADTLEVGEGQNLHDRYPDGLFVNQVYADRDLGLGKVQTSDLAHFRACNAGYRNLYEHFADAIAGHFEDRMGDLDFAEIGCNSGLHLFNLALRGARSCTGYDWNEMGPLFAWLNRILGTDVAFHRSTWNRYNHQLDGADAPEVDVMISSVFLNHQFDPLQHIAYICDRSREAVFLWVLAASPQPHPYVVAYSPSMEMIPEGKDVAGFPDFLNNGISISEPLLRIILERLGFTDIQTIEPPDVDAEWQQFCKGFRAYLAIRTSNRRSTFLQPWKMAGPSAGGCFRGCCGAGNRLAQIELRGFRGRLLRTLLALSVVAFHTTPIRPQGPARESSYCSPGDGLIHLRF